MSKIIKISFVAYNWDDYASQGEAYSEVRRVWEQRASRLPGEYDHSYKSWLKWYSSKYKNEWGRVHFGPEKVIKILEKESSDYSSKIEERTEKLKDFKTPTSLTLDSLVGVKSGVNIDNVSSEVKQFLSSLGLLAKRLGYEKPFVTSGFRSSRSQVRAMANNWNMKGGAQLVSDSDAVSILKHHKPNYILEMRKYTNKPLNKGFVYLFDLYRNKKIVIGLNEIFIELGTGREGVKAGSEFWDTYSGNKSSHRASPASSIDLRKTKGIGMLLNELKKTNEFNFKTLDEGNHFHIEVKGVSNV